MKAKVKKRPAKSFAASIKRAAKVARKRARMYGTRLYFWKDGKVVSERP